MNDLISRQDAIDALERIFNRCEEIEIHLPDGDPDKTGYKMFPDYMTVWKYLRQLPSANQWIPCSEGLPEEENVYLVTFDKSCLSDNEIQVSNALWIDNQWQYDVLESYEHKMPKLVIEPIEELKVTAWIPLPEPWGGVKG